MPVMWSLDGDLVQLNLEGDYQPTDIIDAFLSALADRRCPQEVSLLLDTTRSQSLGMRSSRGDPSRGRVSRPLSGAHPWTLRHRGQHRSTLRAQPHGQRLQRKTWAWTRAFFDPRTRPWNWLRGREGADSTDRDLSLNDPS
jgi:hypothetical protein